MNNLLFQLACLASVVLSVFLFRFEVFIFKVFALILLLLLLVWAVLACMAVFHMVRSSLQEGFLNLHIIVIMAGVLGVVLFAGLGVIVLQASRVPPIHHISTDTDNPPEFELIRSLRAADDNPLFYSDSTKQLQRAHYPDIKPILLDVPPEKALITVLFVMDQLNWTFQQQNQEKGLIEASVTSGLFGFVDDVAVRVTSDGQGSRVDIRSISRIGKSDLGANAKRIRAFTQALQQALGEGH